MTKDDEENMHFILCAMTKDDEENTDLAAI